VIHHHDQERLSCKLIETKIERLEEAEPSGDASRTVLFWRGLDDLVHLPKGRGGETKTEKRQLLLDLKAVKMAALV
jgi:hypothetical protein